MFTADERLNEILTVLRRGAKRVTAAKRVVATVLLEADRHLTAEELSILALRRQPDISSSTIYRILEEFESLGIVVHAHLGQGAAVFHLAGSEHAHLTCDECGATLEVAAHHFDALGRELYSSYGFTLNRHHVAISGTCDSCREITQKTLPNS